MKWCSQQRAKLPSRTRTESSKATMTSQPMGSRFRVLDFSVIFSDFKTEITFLIIFFKTYNLHIPIWESFLYKKSPVQEIFKMCDNSPLMNV